MKDKRRNSEKRKEKSRDAARCRRSKETEVFFELANSLPLPASVTSQLDKASVMRLAISFLKISSVLEQHNWSDPSDGKSKTEEKLQIDHLYPKSLEGFVFILSREGDIIYISESVSKYLGIQQIELIGQSIYDFAHPCDHDEIREVLSVRTHGSKTPVTEERVFFLRMKCTLTSKGRNVNLKSATYKVIKCTGRLVIKSSRRSSGSFQSTLPYLLSVGEPIPHPANIEIPMDGNTFLSKHDMNMHFTYCDERVQDLLCYSSDELLGKSLYDYHHALDSEIVEKAYKDLFAKGQTMTGQYRFLARGGGMAWVITQATVIHNSRSQKAQWIVCVHYVLSHVEQKELKLSKVQLPLCLPPMQPRTESVFLSDIATAINRDDVDDDSEDMMYRAPTPGEECVPLTFPTFSQVAQLASRDKERHLSSPPALLGFGLKKEPAMSPPLCRSKDVLSCSASPSSNSSASSRQINSPHDYLNVANPDLIMSMDKFFQAMDTKADGKEDIEEIDFDSRAPYIPMSGEEDFSLLPPSTESLLMLQNEVNPGLFGKTESVFTRKSDLFEEPPHPPKPSVREMIGGSTTVASIQQPPSTMLQQIKRPLDMNSLEKGPPASKAMRLGQIELNVPAMTSRDSVLLNLLLTGEDRNHGYKVKSSAAADLARTKTKQELLRAHLFPGLTQQDFEVNAPAQDSHLLQGAELLRALEIDPLRMEQPPR
ncbi:endothelial PAS domain-containing protein 1-like isoform X1 [Pomacea canaliculata]|uniref:endothelial PAS domain-containing protein 1-like isoform X1 n=1 Tax=Pomacea canaliculata TaxID=400727 RepID=UPI000D73960E|nr:endothelial PAS domain-containing protein 1-like isoform X1 [Pomacea canaliculata]